MPGKDKKLQDPDELQSSHAQHTTGSTPAYTVLCKMNAWHSCSRPLQAISLQMVLRVWSSLGSETLNS